MSSTTAKSAVERAPRVPGPIVATLHFLALCGAAAVIVETTRLDHWKLGALTTIALFSVVSEWTGVRASARITISGSFLGIMLAAVMLGPAPASLLGCFAMAVGWLRHREPWSSLRNNLVNYIWFPLVASLVFRWSLTATHSGARSIGMYLLVFVAFVVGLALNFVLAVGYQCFLERSSLLGKVQHLLVPVLPAELFSASLTLGAVYVYTHLGTIGLILCALMFVIYQYLVGEMLTSKRRSVALQRIATTDDLTGLANREHFRAVVEQRIAGAREAGTHFAVLLMDLDRFKEINDTLGHHYGDVLLKDLGPRLVEAVGEGGLVARLGGDEFGILLGEDTDDPATLDVALAHLFKLVSEPFAVDELSLEVGASVGVARFPNDGEDSHALLRCADVAMYAAKEAQTDYKVYSAEQNQHSVRRLSVLSDIRHALASDEIVVHYQPIIDLDDLRVRGAEGLVRWQHPEHGLIPPGAFVQTIEQTGLIGPLTRHVLESAIAECATWRRGGREMSVAVNLSVRNLLDRDLPKEIDRLLNTYSLPPNALQLEITESMIMSDPERMVGTVSRLSALGVRLSVDDFGTGYSSLANLRKMPIDELKIDRSFVSPMLQDESDLIIVRSTINLGHDLGLNVIAEGVEDSATLDRLATLGCDLAQGYHVSRPMPADAFGTWLGDSAVADYVSQAAALARGGDTGGQPSVPSVPASYSRGAVDLAGVTMAAPER
jgi:diguanylate cyclase (GGDEF)-like protein